MESKILLKVFTLLCCLLVIMICKPLTKEVLEYLQKDHETFVTFREKYKQLSCKLLVFSRLQYMFENETIDEFMNMTVDKHEYVDRLGEAMMEKCSEEYTNNQVLSYFIK
jgi:deoxyxylulose-5-phosphate synthase